MFVSAKATWMLAPAARDLEPCASGVRTRFRLPGRFPRADVTVVCFCVRESMHKTATTTMTPSHISMVRSLDRRRQVCAFCRAACRIADCRKYFFVFHFIVFLSLFHGTFRALASYMSRNLLSFNRALSNRGYVCDQNRATALPTCIETIKSPLHFNSTRIPLVQ